MATTFRAVDRRVSRLPLWIQLLPIAVLATAGFLWGLGSSSLFVDEVYSWRAAVLPMEQLLDRVRAFEVAPPTYYVLLHEWIGHGGSDNESFMRLSSALGAGGLVVVVGSIAGKVARPPAAVAAALLTALSPLVLQYGQQVRAYVWLMLAVALCAAAAIEADRAATPAARRKWVVVTAGFAVVSFWIHYTAVLVLIPLVVWMARRPWLKGGGRLLFLGGVLAGMVPLVPLMSHQLQQGHEAGVAPAARLNWENLAELVATPLDGRYDGLVAVKVIGALVVGATMIWLWRNRDVDIQYRRLLITLAIVPVLVVVWISMNGKSIVITRYTAVAAPFFLVVLGAVAARAPRKLGLPVVGLVATLGIIGVIASHLPSGHYPNTRGAVRAAADAWVQGDALIADDYAGIGPNLEYYGGRYLPAGALIVNADDRRGILQAMRERRRLWVLANDESVSQVRSGLDAAGFRERAIEPFAGGLRLLLAERR